MRYANNFTFWLLVAFRCCVACAVDEHALPPEQTGGSSNAGASNQAGDTSTGGNSNSGGSSAATVGSGGTVTQSGTKTTTGSVSETGSTTNTTLPDQTESWIRCQLWRNPLALECPSA